MEKYGGEVVGEIQGTQYLMPDGRKRSVTFPIRCGEVLAAAEELVAAGAYFDVEMLSDYETVSVTCEIENEESEVEVLAAVTVENGPPVRYATHEMILDARKQLSRMGGLQ